MFRITKALPGDFTFTRSQFLHRNIETYKKYLIPKWAKKPITYLELGVFEGSSLIWMLQNILTHPDSKAVGIDPWLMTTKLSSEEMTNVMLRAITNVNTWKAQGKCILIRGNSIEVLPKMLKKGGYKGIRKGNVDICMIDGDHTAFAVLEDAKKCLNLMKPGGWMLFDDVENQTTKKDHVKQGIKMIMKCCSDQIVLLWKDRYMECYQVKD